MILDGSKDAVLVLNERLLYFIYNLTHNRGYIEIFNPSAENLFGFNADEVLGQHASLILPARTMELFAERVKRLQNRKGNKEPIPTLDDTEICITNKSIYTWYLFLT